MPDINILPAYAEMHTTAMKYIRLQGSAGSGKSEACTRFVIAAALQHERRKVLVMRKVARTLRTSVFATFLDVLEELGLSSHFYVTTSPMEMTNKFNGSKILFMGVDDPEKLKSIRGISLVFLEEFTEFTKKDFRQIRLRLRTPDNAPFHDQVLMAYNPISKKTFVYKDIHEGGMLEGHELFIKTTYKDNPYLPATYRQELNELAESSDPAYAKIYADGEFADLIEGLIYKQYNVTPDFKFFRAPVYGLDFGFSSDQTALVKVGEVPQAGRKPDKLFADEVFYELNLTANDITALMHEYRVPKNAKIYADHRPEIIEEIQRAGWSGCVKAVKGAGSINSGIMLVQGYELNFTENSVNLQREAELYKWKEDRDGEPLPEPIDKFNHGLDAIRMAVTSMKGKKNRKPASQPIPQARAGQPASSSAASQQQASRAAGRQPDVSGIEAEIEALKKRLLS
jgi:phage terminase large subunit